MQETKRITVTLKHIRYNPALALADIEEHGKCYGVSDGTDGLAIIRQDVCRFFWEVFRHGKTDTGDRLYSIEIIDDPAFSPNHNGKTIVSIKRTVDAP